MNTAPQPGPRLSDLARDQSGGAGAPASVQSPVSGGVFINDSAKQAIMTSPIQAARIRAQASKERLKRLAHDLASQRHGF